MHSKNVIHVKLGLFFLHDSMHLFCTEHEPSKGKDLTKKFGNLWKLTKNGISQKF